LNNWRMAQLHAQEAPDRVLELERYGALFDRTKDGLILQRDFGGHRYARLAHVGDRTGLEMIRTLQYHGIHQGIDVYMECNIEGLLKDGARVGGAFGYWRNTGKFVLFKAKAIVLATGGIGRAWKFTSNSWEYTGDGQSLALWACGATRARSRTARASGSCSTTSLSSLRTRPRTTKRNPTAHIPTLMTPGAP